MPASLPWNKPLGHIIYHIIPGRFLGLQELSRNNVLMVQPKKEENEK